MRKFIIFTLISFSFNTLAAAGELQFDKLMSQFESAQGPQQVAVGNQLMKALNDEQFTDELYQFSTTTPTDSVKQQVWYWGSEYYYDKQDYKKAIDYGKKALSLSKGKDIEADCLNLLAMSCFRMSRFQEAATYAKQCYALDEKSGDPDVMSSSLNTLAGIYLGANQPHEAEKYILRAIELAKKVDNPARMSVLQGKASEVYHALVNDKKALEHINIACDIEQKLGRHEMLMVRNAQKASVLIGLEKYREAEAILRDVIPFMRKVGDKLSLGIACNKMGKALLAQKRNREAIPYYREAADIFMSNGDISNEMHSRRGLYESLWSINPDSAKLELDRFDLLKDSLYSNANAETLARYNAEFGNDQLLQENEQRKQFTHYIIIGSIIIALLIALLVWWLMSRRMHVREEALQATINALRNEKEDASLSQESSTLSEQDQQLLHQVVECVKKGIENGKLSIETIASDVCLSRSQLNRRVKAITGVTTQQYVNRVRLEQARELLANPTLQVSEVAYQCGFDDVASFSRSFRRAFGVSPSHHRNSDK
jgi:AraC-like DNA-binding protein